MTIHVIFYKNKQTNKLEARSPREVSSCYGRAMCHSFRFRGAYAGSQLGKMIPLRSHKETSRLTPSPAITLQRTL